VSNGGYGMKKVLAGSKTPVSMLIIGGIYPPFKVIVPVQYKNL
jgi:hypothetical protein